MNRKNEKHSINILINFKKHPLKIAAISNLEFKTPG